MRGRDWGLLLLLSLLWGGAFYFYKILDEAGLPPLAIFTAIVAHFATADERFSSNKIAGIGLGFVGIIVLFGPDALHGFNVAGVAQLACLGATISYSVGIVYGKRLRETPPMVIAAGQLVASSIMVLPLEVLIDKPWMLPAPPWQVWAALAAMAILGTSAAYIVYFSILRTSGAVSASMVTLLVPVVALILGGVLLHESLHRTMIAGMALIFIGLLALDGRVLRAASARPFGPTAAERQPLG